MNSSLDGGSVYGYCSRANCGAPITSRTRGIPCHDTCARGHRELAAKTLKKAPGRKQSYVCGFMFDPLGGLVVMIEKNRPAWQAGKLNGIGGKINAGEDTHEAMSREFREETGVETKPNDWSAFAVLSGPDFEVHFLRTYSDSWCKVATAEDERVLWVPVDKLASFPRAPNIDFLIPLALSKETFKVVQLVRDLPDEAFAA